MSRGEFLALAAAVLVVAFAVYRRAGGAPPPFVVAAAQASNEATVSQSLEEVSRRTRRGSKEPGSRSRLRTSSQRWLRMRRRARWCFSS